MPVYGTLNTFSGNQQDRKAGPVLVGFCGVRHDDITELEVSWCKLKMTRSGPGSDRGLPSTHIGMSDRSIYEIETQTITVHN